MRPSVLPAWTVGERKLPDGRAVLLVLAMTLAACGGSSAPPMAGSATPPASASATPPTAASTSGLPPVPTLGGPAATGVVLPTYFVTILESRYGLVSVVTTPGSVCAVKAVMPDGAERSDPELRTPRTADGGGRASFSYPATSAPTGLGIHTVSCELATQREQAQARFEVK